MSEDQPGWLRDKWAALTENYALFYCVPDPHWALGLECITTDFNLICADDSDLLQPLQDAGVSVWCADRDGGSELTNRSAGSLLRLNAVRDWIKSQSQGKTPAILVFKPSPQLEVEARKQGYVLIAPPSDMNRLFEDKITFARFMQELGIRQPPYLLLDGQTLNYGEIAVELGEPFVAQSGRGFAGNSSQIIVTPEDWELFVNIAAGSPLKLSRMITGIPITLNACIVGERVYQSHIFYQITGLKAFNRFALGTCGNDYAYPFDFAAATITQIEAITTQVAKAMMAKGYQGIFGLDLIVDEREVVYLIETNPRLTASIPVFSRLQKHHGLVPFLAWHILALLGELDGVSWPEAKSYQVPFGASQLILRNVADEPKVVRDTFATGFYRADGAFVSPGREVGALPPEAGYLVMPVMRGRRVNSNMEYVNIQTTRSILTQDGKLKMDVDEFALKWGEKMGFIKD